MPFFCIRQLLTKYKACLIIGVWKLNTPIPKSLIAWAAHQLWLVFAKSRIRPFLTGGEREYRVQGGCTYRPFVLMRSMIGLQKFRRGRNALS